MEGEDGKKFKTRSGETVKLTDLLTEAVRIAGNDIRERRSEEGGEGYEVGSEFFFLVLVVCLLVFFCPFFLLHSSFQLNLSHHVVSYRPADIDQH